MNHMVKELAIEKPISIPHLIENKLELCYSTYIFEKVIELRTLYFQFTGIPSPELFSDPVLFENIEMNKINSVAFEKTISVPVKKSGVINGLRLTSPLIVGEGVQFQSSDSLMPPVVIPLLADTKVVKGQTLKVQIQYETNTVWNRFVCRLEK